ncbi:MAG TPA: hypothetical protein VHX38_18040 [Pseudonocardiaceae bacterium]|nr:hypothetical protein [Pseudonocardiaceae bacterium]
MRAWNPLDEAEQATINSPPVARPNVVGLRLVGVAERLRLSGGEVAALSGAEFEEPPTKVTSIN